MLKLEIKHTLVQADFLVEIPAARGVEEETIATGRFIVLFDQETRELFGVDGESQAVQVTFAGLRTQLGDRFAEVEVVRRRVARTLIEQLGDRQFG